LFWRLGIITKVVFTTCELEHPPKGGPRLRVENSIKALNRVADVVLVSRQSLEKIGGHQAVEYYSQYCSRILFLAEPVASRAAKSLLEIAEAESADVLWLGFGNISYDILYHLRLLDCPYPIVVDTDSVWSRFLLRGLAYQDKFDAKLRIFAKGWLKRWEEDWAARMADITTAVSTVDARYYELLSSRPDSVRIFSNVIDPGNYDGIYPNPGILKPCIFLGGTFWPGCPMEQATRWMIDKVMPLVRNSIANAHLYVVGKGSEYLADLLCDPKMTMTGTVPSVLPYLKNADVAVVPLRFESGTRFKIMEAGICNVPIVSTTLGAEGIPVINGQEVIIADTPEDFARGIIEVITRPELVGYLTENCRRLIEEQYSISTAAEEAREILLSLTPGRFSRKTSPEPDVVEIAEKLYASIASDDLGTMFAFATALFSRHIDIYGNSQLFLLDEERREIEILLGQLKQYIPDNSSLGRALWVIQRQTQTTGTV
jgi:glycosyltransferase involved in cell wall biosynthesis